jgi:predicted O-methyltransferase YrrM
MLTTIQIMIWRVQLRMKGYKNPSEIFTHLTLEERLFLYRKALSVGHRKKIVEIGSYLGASSCFLAIAAKERGSTVHCIDTWNNEGMTEGPRDTYTEFMKNTVYYQDVIKPLRMRSEQAALLFNGPIDLLFLDGDHSYEAITMDLSLWVPKMTMGAWLILHDFGWAEGVQQAISEFVMPLQLGRPRILPNMYGVRINPDAIQNHNKQPHITPTRNA